MVVLKVLFSNDLRRISVEDGVGLNEVNQRIKQLFNLPLTYCGLNIVWTPKEGQKQIITSDKQWAEVVASANETDNILRLEIQKSTSSQPPIQPEEPSLNSPSSILDRPDVRKHLESIIAETIQSKPFVDLIAQKLSVYLKDTEMKENAPIEKQELAVSETVPTVVLDSLKRSLLEQKVEEPVIPVIETKEEKQEELPKVEEKPEDTFVVVQEIKEKAEGLATSPLVKSVLSFFKSFKKDEPKASANEKEISEEKLEEMLKQLNDMGFTDREANLKALKFHNNYQEGLDAVVEDLLTQIQPQQEAEKEEEVIEEPLIQPQKKEEPVIVKEVPPKPQETDPNGIEGITAEDIERLMRHANISREAAIKALRSQLW